MEIWFLGNILFVLISLDDSLERIVINIFKYYQDSVDELRKTFNRLEFVMNGEPVIYLADPAFREFALLFWDVDKDGYISPDEAQISRLPNFNRASADIEIVDFRQLTIGGSYNSIPTYVPNVREVYCGRNPGNGNTVPFSGFEHLEFVDIGAWAKYIPGNAYSNNPKLRKVVLNDVLEVINNNAFTNCVSLEEISEIPDSCTLLYNQYSQQAFRGCTSLKTITIGRGMQRIGWSTFRDCTSMEAFYIKAITPPQLDTEVFTNNPCKIYVPRGSGTIYKAATNWSAYADRIHEYDF